MECHVDDALVKECLSGSRSAQYQLYGKYEKKMMAVCLRYAADSYEAEDILSLGFTRIFRKLESYSGSGSLEGWIRKVMVNCALSHYQKNKSRMGRVPLDECPEPLMEACLPSDSEYLWTAVRSLPEILRIPFTMFAIDGYSHREISMKLLVSEAVSKVRVSRARQLLQLKLSDMNLAINFVKLVA